MTAAETRGGKILVTVGNPDEIHAVAPIVTIRKVCAAQKLRACDLPCAVLTDTADRPAVRVNIPAEETAVLVVE